MAATNLIPYSTGADESDLQNVGQGEVHTIIPVVRGTPGKVAVYLLGGGGEPHYVASLGHRKGQSKDWQIQGPASYVVKTKNAGCDVDVGT